MCQLHVILNLSTNARALNCHGTMCGCDGRYVLQQFFKWNNALRGSVGRKVNGAKNFTELVAPWAKHGIGAPDAGSPSGTLALRFVCGVCVCVAVVDISIGLVSASKRLSSLLCCAMWYPQDKPWRKKLTRMERKCCTLTITCIVIHILQQTPLDSRGFAIIT